MTKFEEEVKRPVIGIGQSSIKPALGKAVEFYTDKVKEYHNAFSDMNKYIDVIENALEKKDEEIADLKCQLQQQALPVVPEFVGNYISGMKENGENIAFAIMCNIYNVAGEGNAKAIHWKDSNPEDFARAWLDGYQVEKPQLFYLKHIDMSKVDETHDWFILRHGNLGHSPFCKGELPYYCNNAKYTQKEIDSMQTGSYEQIEVEE